MGYQAKGVEGNGKGYAVVHSAVREKDSVSGSGWKLVGEVGEVRLMMEDTSTGPFLNSWDSYKIRYACKVNAGVSRGDLEAWLASKPYGVRFPCGAIQDLLRLVHDAPDTKAATLGFYVWVDVFYPGKGNEVVHWYDDPSSSEGEESEEEELWEEEEEDDLDGPTLPYAASGYRTEEITEEAGCAVCGLDKADVGSYFTWLPCGHSFHSGSIAHHMYEHRFCPTCNYKLPLASIFRFKNYPCVCTQCLCLREIDPTLLPDHPPPYIKFY